MIPIGYVSTAGNTLGVPSIHGVNPVDGLWYAVLDPASPGAQLTISDYSAATPAYGTNPAPIPTTTSIITPGLSSYVSGSYTRDKFGTYPVGQANRTDWRSFWIGFMNFNQASIQIRYLMDNQQTKLSTFTLTLGFRCTWNRVL
jgi:hypothetical protein